MVHSCTDSGPGRMVTCAALSETYDYACNLPAAAPTCLIADDTFRQWYDLQCSYRVPYVLCIKAGQLAALAAIAGSPAAWT